MVITFTIRPNTNINRSTGNGFSISARRAGKLNPVKAAVNLTAAFFIFQSQNKFNRASLLGGFDELAEFARVAALDVVVAFHNDDVLAAY